MEDRLAIQKIESPTVEPSALRNEYAFGSACGDRHIRSHAK